MTTTTQSAADIDKQRRRIRIFWIVITAPVAFLFLVFLLISVGALGFMPTFEELENPKSSLASEVLSDDGVLLGKFYKQNRTRVNFSDVSPYVFQALVGTEDERFYEHSGIDVEALMRVAKGILTFNRQGGGSTISQQLAKNLFPRDTIRNRFFLTRGLRMATIKFKEWITAVKLERNYTKEEIIVMYLNTVAFGHETYGIKSAARTFFDKNPKDLKVEEAAVLVGLLKAPTKYSPRLHPDNALRRRNTVFQQMVKNKFLTEDQYEKLKVLPIKLHFRLQDHNDGLATYFREYLRLAMQSEKPERKNYANIQSFRDDSLEWETNPLFGWCNKNTKPNGEHYNLYRDGLRIHTTLNSKMQRYAEEAMMRHMALDLQPAFYKHKRGSKNGPFSADLTDEQIAQIMKSSIRRSERYRVLKLAGMSENEITQNFNTKTEMTVFRWKNKVDTLHAPVQYYEEFDTIMSPRDSIIYYKYFLHNGLMSMDPHTGYVRAYVGGINYTHFKYDHVKMGRRQVGSTFKPFIYTLAMLNGFSPCSRVMNIPYTFNNMPDGQPPYTPKYSSSGRDGEMITLKYALANSLNQISAFILKQYTPKDAIKLARLMGVKSPIDPVPAICVGAADIYLSEMVGAYSTFANHGFYTAPIFVTKIEDRNGNTVGTFSTKKNEVISEETAYLMLELMRGVVEEGTSARLHFKYKISADMAGKTGTTNNNSDGWFMGLTRDLVTGVWTGGEDRSIHFNSTQLGQGANMALPVWAMFMQKVFADKVLNVSSGRFDIPSKGLPVEVDCGKYDRNHNQNSPQGDDVLGGKIF